MDIKILRERERERVINLSMKMKYEIMCAGYKDIKRVN